MKRYFAAFWWLYSAVSLAGVLLIVLYLSGSRIDLVHLFKVPLAASVFVLIIFHLRYRLRVIGLTLLFGAAGVAGAIVGAWHGTLLTSPAMTHLYMTVVPILAASFGFYFAEADPSYTQGLLRRITAALFLISLLTLLCYYYLYYFKGSISYFGFDSPLPLVSAMFLADRRYALYLLCVILVIFSGKRAPLIAMASPIALVIARTIFSPRLANVAVSVALVLTVAAGSVWAYNSGLLVRFEPLLELDVTDHEKFYLATSGRSVEFVGLYEHVADEPVRALIGSGFGGQYLVDSEFRGEHIFRYQHYLHMAVLTYALTFGTPFVLALLVYIAAVLWSNRRNFMSFYYLAMLVTLAGSAFGAGLIVEPVFWFFLGANVQQIRHRAAGIRRS